MKKVTKNSQIIISMKSSSVELSVVETGDNTKIIFCKKTVLFFKQSLTPEEFIRESFEALRKLLSEEKVNLLKILPAHSDCRIIVYSPWFLPEIKRVEEKKNKISLKSLINEKVLDQKEENYVQIENKMTNITVKGYHLADIRDISSNDIEIDIFRSYLAKDVVVNFKKMIREILLSVKNIEFSSSAMQSYETIKHIYLNEDNCCFINIGGELTEMGIIEDDVLVKFSTFPIGKHAFARELDEVFEGGHGADKFKFFGDKNSDYSLGKKKEDALKKISLDWIDKLKTVMDEFPREIPKKTFIINTSDSLNFFESILKESVLKDELFFVPIKSEVFSGKISFKDEKVKGVEYLISGYYSQIIS